LVDALWWNSDTLPPYGTNAARTSDERCGAPEGRNRDPFLGVWGEKKIKRARVQVFLNDEERVRTPNDARVFSMGPTRSPREGEDYTPRRG